MTLEFRSTFDTGEIARDIFDSLEAVLKKEMIDIASEIKIDVSGGKSREGGSLGNYSPNYFKRREKIGRNNRRIDLRLTGDMMNSITSTVERRGLNLRGKVFFNRTSSIDPFTKKANLSTTKAERLIQRFNFFGLSKAQERRLIQSMKTGARIGRR